MLPFLPTPDSADRKSKNKQQNFADMVACMDKLIGRIVDKTVELSIAENTLTFVTGDNGTYTSLKSNMGDKVIRGGKGKPTDAGTHICPVGYQPGKVSKDLIDSTDGVSFLPQLHGKNGSPCESIFVYFWPWPEKDSPIRFVRNKRWKLYGDGTLFDMRKDVLEKSPVTSAESSAIRKKLQTAFDRMLAQGQTLLNFD